MRIVFMGTPEFAVPSLKALVEAGYDVAGCFTQPDRPAGRGHALRACPVKLYAQSVGIPVMQVERIRKPDGIAALRALAPDLCVTAAFGQILSAENLAIPSLGTVNVHASLLPRHRGAAPIAWSIWMGETKTGVTTMLTDAGLDTGDMLLSAETDIGAEETAGELTLRLSEMGAGLLIDTLRALERGDCPRKKQDEALSTYEPMLQKDMGRLDFTLPAQTVANRIRAFNPWPGCFAESDDGLFKFWRARATDRAYPVSPGTIARAHEKDGLFIQCGDFAVEILEMQSPNAKRMAPKAYLRGKTIPEGTYLHG